MNHWSAACTASILDVAAGLDPASDCAGFLSNTVGKDTLRLQRSQAYRTGSTLSRARRCSAEVFNALNRAVHGLQVV